MRRQMTLAAVIALASLLPAARGAAAPQDFGMESADAALTSLQAGAHPDLTFSFAVKQDPTSKPNLFGLHDAYASTRNVRFDLPPGLIGNPNVLGVPQQCTVQELITYSSGGGCLNGSQIGLVTLSAYGLASRFTEPLYMMEPPGGDVVARVGFIAGLFATFVDFRVRTEGDFGLVAEVTEAPTAARAVAAETTVWGVPAAPAHDRERCTPSEAYPAGCVVSKSNPPGSRPLPFITNPTRCSVPLQMSVSAASWVEPERFDTATAAFPPIEGCDRLPFGPSLVIEPTNHRAGAPTGLDVTARAPASDGVEVLEPSQTRDIRVALPEGLAINTGSADGLQVCDEDQVHLGKRVAADCPDAAKLAEFEADISALPRRLKGAVYLRDPVPGNPFRFWAVADDLGIHVKLEGTLSVDKATGRIESALLDLPQAPLREVKLVFKSGFRSPLVNPPGCGTFTSTYDFAPWSGGPSVSANAPMEISEGCVGAGGFTPRLSAGTLDPSGGEHSPFVFTLTREDGEQNPASFDVMPPEGIAATFAGVPRCEGAAAERGECPAASRIGRAIVAVGAGPAPLWVPQPGKRLINIYLSGPYKGAPTGIVAVVPRQAGPFDFGDEVVRSAIYIDPLSARATARTDPLPQMIEGIPIRYRTIHVDLDRPGFTLNPTGCEPKATEGVVTSTTGALAKPTSPFEAINCASLGFKPRLSFKLSGSKRRGGHPSLRSVIRPRVGEANIGSLSVALPRSEFLDQAHIKTICTRVQFASKACPAGSIYGKVTATTPLLDQPLSGNIYLRSSSHLLPDMVVVLKGPDSFPVEIDAVGRIDSINGGIRVTFESTPDTPVSKIVASFPGDQKGLLENSTNLCDGVNRVTAKLGAQNGRRYTARPSFSISCGAKRRPKN